EIQNGILKEKLSTPIIIFLLFVVWAFASSLWSLHQMESLKRSSFLILISVGTFCLANQIIRYKISIKKIFLILASVLVGISLFSLITNIPADSWTGGNKDGFMGFVAHQNTLGGILLFLIPFLNYALFKKIF
ncbi:MAG: hypothetical protein C0442_07990, partial [Chlorobiaceae bacterium]|nr:hypothetical protein [Chlorobiaceae bacterium]